MIRIFIMSVLTNFLMLPFAQAQDIQPYLVVKVLDELGEPLSNARVTVSKNGEIVADEFTDSIGTRMIVALELGTHVVSIHYGSKAQKAELNVKNGHNELFMEMGREQLQPIAIEAEPLLIDDSYGGSVSIGEEVIWCKPSCGGLGSSVVFQYWDSPLVGGVWLSDTRAPTFENMMNMQPND